MGYIENAGKSENQPEEEALDTNQDKSLEEAKPSTEEEQKKEETAEAKEDMEEEETTETVKEEETEEAEEELKEKAAEEAGEETPEEIAPTEAEEEEKAEEKKREAPEEEIVEERIYTIPLGRAWISPRKKRTPRAVRIVRSFVQKHMKIETRAKTEEEEEEAGKLLISDEVNEKLWSRGIEKPPRKIRIRAVKDKEGTVTLYLAEGD